MNINGTIDPFYRYKMEPINLISTRKNGGTAIVKNTVAICTSLAEIQNMLLVISARLLDVQ